MKITRWIVLSLLILAMLEVLFLMSTRTIGVGMKKNGQADESEKQFFSTNPEKYHEIELENEELFFREIAKNRKALDLEAKIVGGIVPHHLLPTFIVADFFSKLSREKIKTVILVGPNHHEKGKANIATSDYGWNTRFGTLNPDINIIKDLKMQGIAGVQEDVIAREHAITGLVPFIKYYLPDAKIAPIILKRKTTEEDIGKLLAVIKEYMNEDGVVLVASVDFSHNLTNLESKERDVESLAAIEARDYKAISKFENQNLDSPASISLLLKAVDGENRAEMKVLENTNSGEIFGDDFSLVTSYFSIFFTR